MCCNLPPLCKSLFNAKVPTIAYLCLCHVSTPGVAGDGLSHDRNSQVVVTEISL